MLLPRRSLIFGAAATAAHRALAQLINPKQAGVFIGDQMVPAGRPAWVPAGAKSFYDFANDRGYSNGSVRPSSTSDLTEVRAAPPVTYDIAASTQFAPNVLRRTSAGLLIEPSGSNFCLQSESFASNWSATGTISLTPNAATGPDGTTTAATFLATDTSNSIRNLGQSGTISASSTTTYTASCLFKRAGTNCFIQINTANASAAAVAYFDLTNGLAVVGADIIAGFTAKSVTITAVGNGFYRATFTFTTPASVTGLNVYLGPCQVVSGTGNNQSYTGIVGQGIQIWGYKVEAGAVATSYIPTATVSVTRSADAASLTIPTGATTALFTFSDATTQSVGVSPGPYTIPTNLNKPVIASLGIS